MNKFNHCHKNFGALQKAKQKSINGPSWRDTRYHYKKGTSKSNINNGKCCVDWTAALLCFTWNETLKSLYTAAQKQTNIQTVKKISSHRRNREKPLYCASGELVQDRHCIFFLYTLLYILWGNTEVSQNVMATISAMWDIVIDILRLIE